MSDEAQTTYQAYWDFTGHTRAVVSLMQLHSLTRSNPEGFVPKAAIVVFIAFSVEAYVNSIGVKMLKCWPELERIPWKSKIELLHEVAGKVPDWGQQPLQFVKQAFSARDKLAHGKPERVWGEETSDRETARRDATTHEREPAWFDAFTPSWIRDSEVKIEETMNYLSALAGIKHSYHRENYSSGIVKRVNGQIVSR